MRAYGGAIAFIGFGLVSLLFGVWQEIQFNRLHDANAPASTADITGARR